jgi:hypothetical protein
VGFRCIKSSRECDGCMGCRPEPHYYCPVCGGEVYETVFVYHGGEVIGCENCTEIKEPHEVLFNEID